ncbi:MAG: hypothetical protein AAGD25_29270 [Cyanobacteria bacterium P01_F01_bin.150]
MVLPRILQALRAPKHLPPDQSVDPSDTRLRWLRVSVEYGQSDGFDFACSQRLAIAIGTALTTVFIWLSTVSLPYSACVLMTKMGTVNVDNNLCHQVVTPAAPVRVEGVSPLQ